MAKAIISWFSFHYSLSHSTHRSTINCDVCMPFFYCLFVRKQKIADAGPGDAKMFTTETPPRNTVQGAQLRQYPRTFVD